jgi:hypothetical protein
VGWGGAGNVRSVRSGDNFLHCSCDRHNKCHTTLIPQTMSNTFSTSGNGGGRREATANYLKNLLLPAPPRPLRGPTRTGGRGLTHTGSRREGLRREVWGEGPGSAAEVRDAELVLAPIAHRKVGPSSSRHIAEHRLRRRSQPERFPREGNAAAASALQRDRTSRTLLAGRSVQ